MTGAGLLRCPDDGQVHVWHVDLRDPAWDAAWSVLDPAEQQRVQRVVHVRTREDARRGRIALRLLLARYLGCAAQAIRFEQGVHGKPWVQRPPWPGFFNLSHSDGLALVAVAREEVGVDIERCVARDGMDRLLAQICSPQEAGALDPARSPDLVQHRLYRLWTRKEAYCKATGLGLGRPPRAFSVVGADGSAVARIDDATLAGQGRGWWTHDLPCEPGWAAALAMQHDAPVILQRPWRPALARCA